MGVEPILRDSHSRVLTVTLRTTSILVVREGVEPSLAAHQAALQTATTPYVLVATAGFEPAASWFQTRRSPQTELHRENLFLPPAFRRLLTDLVGAAGFEPASSCFRRRRVRPLRYAPKIFVLMLSELFGGTVSRSFSQDSALRTHHFLFGARRPSRTVTFRFSDGRADPYAIPAVHFLLIGRPGVGPGRRVYKTRQCDRH